MVADTVTEGQQHQRKGVLQPAGQVEQHRELEDVEGEIEGGLALAQPLAAVAAHLQTQVQQGGDGDHAEAGGHRHGRAETEGDQDQGRDLSGQGDPADDDEGADADRAGGDRAAGI